jgi:hypothetical protein
MMSHRPIDCDEGWILLKVFLHQYYVNSTDVEIIHYFFHSHYFYVLVFTYHWTVLVR